MFVMRHIDALSSILRLKNETNLLGEQNSKSPLKRSRFICLCHLCLRRLGEGFLSDFMWPLKTSHWDYFDSRNRRQGVCHHLYKADDLLMRRQAILFTEKLYLSLYYTCTKLRHHLLSSTRIVVCQTDVINHMLQKADFEW